MNTKRFIQILLLCLLTGMAFQACKPRQRIIYSTSPVADKANNQLFNDIISREFQYNTFAAKLNLNLTNGTKSMSSKANIRIVKDKALQISIQPLFGVEMFRFYMNPDTVMVLDRMNKRYVMESIASLKELYPVGFDFYTLQSVFTNNLFVPGKKQVESSDYRKFKYTQTNDQFYYIASKDAKSDINYSFTVNGDDRITLTQLLQPERKQTLEWGYQNFVELNDLVFPSKMHVTLSTSTRRVNAEILFSDIVTNEMLKLTLDVPSGYTRTTVDEMLKIFAQTK